MAAVPPGLDVGNEDGPFAYVGSAAEGAFAVNVMDIGRYTSQGTIKYSTEWPEKVEGFGLAVTAAEFGSDGRMEDLAVGARDMVVLLKAESWPNFGGAKKKIVVSAQSTASTEWPKGDYTKIVSGDLVDNADKSVNHEVVAAVPAENSVAVIYDVNSECFVDDKIPGMSAPGSSAWSYPVALWASAAPCSSQTWIQPPGSSCWWGPMRATRSSSTPSR